MTNVNLVSKQTMQGASVMVLRTLVLYPIGFIGEVCLARFLQPQDFGVYAIASFVTVTLAGVMEVGMGAALIHQPEEPSQHQFQTLFSIQLLVISSLVLILFLLAPHFFPLFGLDSSVRWVMLALLLCPWISSLGAMSCAQIERELRYAVFAKMDVLRGFSYVGVAVSLAFFGWGVWSFVVAILVSTLVRTTVAFHASPWSVRFRLKVSGMEKTLSYGFLFQASTLTSLFRDHIGVLLAGPLFGPQSVGYLNWAKNTTFYTSQIFTQVVSRVTFPSISRIREHPREVQQMVHTATKYVNLLTFPTILIFAALIPEFVSVVFTSKWIPAIPAFYFYSIRMLGSNVTTLHISVLNGLGHVKTSLRILLWWTLVDWILAVTLCLWVGFQGVAMAYAISVIPIAFWLLFVLKRKIKIQLYQILYKPFIISGLAAILVWFLKSYLHPSWLSITILSLTGVATYFALLMVTERESLLKEIRAFLATLARGKVPEISNRHPRG